MKNIRDICQRITFTERSVPLALLALSVLGFGLLTPWLGYYQDDWPYVFYAFNKGIPSLAEELFYDSRPNAAWLYISAFHLLGFNPLFWHVAALILRWLTATILWYLLRRIWPGHTRQATFTTILFIIHPFFLIQPAAVNSILYWAGYLLFATSLWIMARNVTEEKYRFPLTALAVFLAGLHLFTTEYYVGMEMARPLILYWMFQDKEPDTRRRLFKTLKNWFPYLGMWILYMLWRIFFFIPPPGGDRNPPRILFDLFTNPIRTLSHQLRIALQDSLIITFTSWYRTLGPELFALSSRFDWIIILVSIITFSAVVIFLIKVQRKTDNGAGSDKDWSAKGLILGLVFLVLGILPLWLIGQDIVTHKNQYAASRFGIGSTLGAALILAAIIEAMIDDRRKKAVIISLCAALAVGMHLGNERIFKYSWEKQTRFYQQLAWRAPKIEPGTAIVTDQEILPFMGGYATSFGIITTYQPGNIKTPPYWYFAFYYSYPDIDSFIQGIPLEDGRVSMSFSGWSTDSLIVDFEPELNRCLWVLRPEERNLRLVNEDQQKISAVSAVSRIQRIEGNAPSLPKSIYGTRVDQGWCYYFEKADLARQYGQWNEVIKLWEQAKSQNEQAGNGFEYLPFIEGFAHQADWTMVKSLTKAANKTTQGLQPTLCESLDRFMLQTEASPDRDHTIEGLKDYLVCKNYQ
jgi:hypothetical protein